MIILVIDPLRLNFDKEVLGALGIKVDYEPLQELYKMIYESFTQWFALGKARVKTNKQKFRLIILPDM